MSSSSWISAAEDESYTRLEFLHLGNLLSAVMLRRREGGAMFAFPSAGLDVSSLDPGLFGPQTGITVRLQGDDDPSLASEESCQVFLIDIASSLFPRFGAASSDPSLVEFVTRSGEFSGWPYANDMLEALDL